MTQGWRQWLSAWDNYNAAADDTESSTVSAYSCSARMSGPRKDDRP